MSHYIVSENLKFVQATINVLPPRDQIPSIAFIIAGGAMSHPTIENSFLNF
jgi:hypothetical protein